MSRRGDNIHKRSDGRWEGRYIASRDELGKAVYKSVYARTYADCSEKLKLAPAQRPTSAAECARTCGASAHGKPRRRSFKPERTLPRRQSRR
ncbi:MAG: hypothetical protein J5956_13120 [Ruminococcus sp.]|nr:hypothetical protein [Ruminococcus sp.]